MVSSIGGFHCIQDSQLGPNVYRTASWVPMVSSIERFHCIIIHTLHCAVFSIGDLSQVEREEGEWLQAASTKCQSLEGQEAK